MLEPRATHRRQIWVARADNTGLDPLISNQVQTLNNLGLGPHQLQTQLIDLLMNGLCRLGHAFHQKEHRDQVGAQVILARTFIVFALDEIALGTDVALAVTLAARAAAFATSVALSRAVILAIIATFTAKIILAVALVAARADAFAATIAYAGVVAPPASLALVRMTTARHGCTHNLEPNKWLRMKNFQKLHSDEPQR